jgi:tetratricopeptide (TPR) repeat protein
VAAFKQLLADTEGYEKHRRTTGGFGAPDVNNDWHDACIAISKSCEALGDLEAAYEYAVLARGKFPFEGGFCAIPCFSARAGLNRYISEIVLREAAETTLKQGPEQEYWTERVLLDIGNVQIRARDFKGAERSICGSTYDYGNNAGIVELAEALAGDGKLEKARDTLRALGPDHGWRQDYLDDGMQWRWIEHLISTGARERAARAIEQLQSESYRADGLRMLALAYAKSGDAARAAVHFGAAIAAAEKMTDERDRARALWKTAGAQLEAREIDAANETLRKIVEQTEYRDPWAKAAALVEAGALAFKMKDFERSRRLFRRAIESCETLDTAKFIATAQADVGDVDGALQTLDLVAGDRGYAEALSAVVPAMLKTGDIERAIRTTFSITSIQYRDEAAQTIVDYHLQKRNLPEAAAVAERIKNSSTKAAEMLRVATAHARLGDRRAAADVAARIELTGSLLGRQETNQRFDYRSPATWGVCYEPAFTMASTFHSQRQAARVAAAAMRLAQALGQKPSQPYEISFKKFDAEAIRALARAQAGSGNADDALRWARRIGSGGKIPSEDHLEAALAVQQRVHALIGAAEGLLDLSSGVSGESRPWLAAWGAPFSLNLAHPRADAPFGANPSSVPPS